METFHLLIKNTLKTLVLSTFYNDKNYSMFEFGKYANISVAKKLKIVEKDEDPHLEEDDEITEEDITANSKTEKFLV